jgi:transcription initiation factor IIE alpha subunit
MAVVKIAELKGLLERKADREVNLESYRDQEALGASLSSSFFVTCVNCIVQVEFENFVLTLEGEESTTCPSCGESLNELAE